MHNERVLISTSCAIDFLNYGQRAVRAFNQAMPVSTEFAAKSPAQIEEALVGFEPSCVAAALRYRESGEFEDFWAMLPGIIAFHLPRSAARPPAVLEDEMRLNEDLGLDSLGVLAIADIVENKYGISLDDERIAGVRTLSDFKDLVVLKIAEVA